MGNTAMSCHLKSTEPMISLKKATRLLNTKYKILHTTIQVEDDKDLSTNFECESYH
jgi:hypothetical protein